MLIKKLNKLILGIMILIFMFTIVAVIYNLLQNGGQSGKNIKVSLYFVDKVNYTLKEEERVIENGTNTQVVSRVLEELVLGPKNQSYVKSVPSEIEILEVKINNNAASVNLSEEYNTLKASDALFCRAALVYTLTELDFIDGVKILIAGSELLKANGEVLGVISREDIVMSDKVTPEPLQNKRLKLYFSNTEATELIIEEREIEVSSEINNQQLSKKIIEQLIIGPRALGLIATIPTETKLKDIQIKDGICYVDFSTEFVTKHSGGSSEELLTVESVVNSLTEISEIKKVQFLVEGEKLQEFKGHIDFSQPFERTVE